MCELTKDISNSTYELLALSKASDLEETAGFA